MSLRNLKKIRSEAKNNKLKILEGDKMMRHQLPLRQQVQKDKWLKMK